MVPSTVGNRPEVELLLCCARNCINAKRSLRVKALVRADIDWRYLIAAATFHGVRPLLYWTLQTTCPEAVPTRTLGRLREHFCANAGRNLFVATELTKVLSRLEADGILAIPFKGPLLTDSVYGDLAFREFSDLDILVRQHDVVRAKRLLTSQGYRMSMQLNGAQEVAYLESGYHLGFVRDDGGVMVELHWNIVEKRFSLPLDTERLWDRARPVPFLGRTVLGFSPEDLLLILCVHGAKHCWPRLGWIYDVAQLIDVHPGMNWGEALERGRSVGAERAVLLGLLLAGRLLGRALPGGVVRRIQADQVVAALAGHVRRRLFQEIEGSVPFEANLDAHLFYLRVRERLKDRAACLLHLAMSPNERDRKFLALPASCSVLYYPVRAIRLIGRYGLHPRRLRRVVVYLRGILDSGASA